MILYNKKNVFIFYDQEKSMVFLKWTGFTTSKEFKNVLDATFDFMTKEKIHMLISDIIEQKVIPPCDQDYFKESVVKFYKKTKSLKIAYISDQKSIAHFCTLRSNKSIINEINLEISRFFNCEEDAILWLRDM